MEFNDDPRTGSAELGMTPQEVQQYDITKAIHAALSGNWDDAGLEREASRAAEKLQSEATRGFTIPYDVLAIGRRDVSSSTAPGLVGTDQKADAFIELMRNNSILANVGATIYPGLVGDVDVPRQITGNSATWIDNETYSGSDETNPTYTALTLAPKTLRMRTDISRKMLKQSMPSADKLVMDDLRAVSARTIDAAAISGTGADGIPEGILEAAGVNNIDITGTDGGPINWADLVEMETALGNHLQLPGKAYVTNTNVLGQLKTLPRHATANVGGYLMDGAGLVNGHPCHISNTIPSNLVKGGSGATLSGMIFGAWSSLVVGLWGGLDIEVDKVTLANRGGIVLHAFQDVDLGLRYAGAFSKIEDITTT